MPLEIVYIDDEVDLLSLFEDTFSDSDIRIRTFADVGKAKEAILEKAPDLVFIDFRLPGTTGDQVANDLDPKIPKALITGDLQVNTSYKFDAVFEKPYNIKAIREFIKKHGPKN